MGIVSYLRERNMEPKIQHYRRFYEKNLSHDERLKYQLESFNREWLRIKVTVPFYRDLVNKNRLPHQFQSIDDVVNLLPIIDSTTIQVQRDRLAVQGKKPDFRRITGGSTNRPIQLPAFNRETDLTSPLFWLARSWFTIKPSDRLFLIWGHEHLVGKSWNGLKNRYTRFLKDYLLGYYRYSSYNLGGETMRYAGNELLRFRPKYIKGYSISLDSFARANIDRASHFHRLGLKAVIATGEMFPFHDSEEVVKNVFGAPVVMEYGSMEAWIIAHTTPRNDYQVFWGSYFFEATEEGTGGGRILRLTSLYPRCFPLIRYQIGDEIELYPGDDGLGVTRFKRVIGRLDDNLILKDGSIIHSFIICENFNYLPNIRGYQVVRKGSEYKIHVVSDIPVSKTFIHELQRRLGHIHPLLANIRVERVESLRKSPAGKTPVVINDYVSMDL